MFAITPKNSVNEVIVQRMLEVLFLHVMVYIVIEVGVVDGVYVDVLVGSREGSPEEGVVLLSVYGMG